MGLCGRLGRKPSLSGRSCSGQLCTPGSGSQARPPGLLAQTPTHLQPLQGQTARCGRDRGPALHGWRVTVSPYITGQQQHPIRVGRGVLTSFCPPQLSLERTGLCLQRTQGGPSRGWAHSCISPFSPRQPAGGEWRHGSQKRALSPDHPQPPQRGPGVRSEGSGGTPWARCASPLWAPFSAAPTTSPCRTRLGRLASGPLPLLKPPRGWKSQLPE